MIPHKDRPNSDSVQKTNGAEEHTDTDFWPPEAHAWAGALALLCLLMNTYSAHRHVNTDN